MAPDNRGSWEGRIAAWRNTNPRASLWVACKSLPRGCIVVGMSFAAGRAISPRGCGAREATSPTQWQRQRWRTVQGQKISSFFYLNIDYISLILAQSSRFHLI